MAQVPAPGVPAGVPALPPDWFGQLINSPWPVVLILAVCALVGYAIHTLSKNKGAVSLDIRGAASEDPSATGKVSPVGDAAQADGPKMLGPNGVYDLTRQLRAGVREDGEAQIRALREDIQIQLDALRVSVTADLRIIAQQRYNASPASSLTQDDEARARAEVLRRILEGVGLVRDDMREWMEQIQQVIEDRKPR